MMVFFMMFILPFVLFVFISLVAWGIFEKDIKERLFWRKRGKEIEEKKRKEKELEAKDRQFMR